MHYIQTACSLQKYAFRKNKNVVYVNTNLTFEKLFV